MRKMYKYLDSLLEKAKESLRTEFNRVSVMGFDELNVTNTRKTTSEMYDRLLAYNDKMYLKAANKAYKTAHKESETELDEEWLLEALASFNLVTGYLYKREAERKRLRLNEQILTAREFSDSQAFNSALRKSANLWWTQTTQYGIDIVDKATLKAYKDRGIKKVRWVTQKDESTCEVCGSRHNKVYKITAVPGKTHYGCRCYVVPFTKEE